MLNNVEDEICYICHDNNTNQELFSPCACKSKVHEKCLIYWIYNRPKKQSLSCEVCQKKYNNLSMSSFYLNCFNRFYKCLFLIMLFFINYGIGICIFSLWNEEYVTISLRIFLFIFSICIINLLCSCCGIICNLILVNTSCMQCIVAPHICFNKNKYSKSPLIQEIFPQEKKKELVINMI